MEAGRNLDGLIAEKVMGITFGDGGSWYKDGIQMRFLDLPKYSEDKNSALLVLAGLAILGSDIYSKFLENMPRLSGVINPGEKIKDWLDGMTPLEICEAALKAVEARRD